MGDIGYRKELPEGTYLLDEEPEGSVSGQYRAIVIEPDVFERVQDYTRSSPTGPSPGRVYRKNHGWPPNMDDNWFVFFVIDGPDKGQIHVPYSVLLT